MPEISFSLIYNDNLNNKNLKIKQVESVIEVKGDLEPYQIQKIRDHVSDSVNARRKNINDVITQQAKKAVTAKGPERRKIIQETEAAIRKSTAAFDKKVQAMVSDFCQKDIELAQAARTGRWQFVVSTIWDVGSLLWNGSEVMVETGGAMATGGATALLALKKMLDLWMEFDKFVITQTDAWRGLEGQENRLNAALDKLRKIKKGAQIPLSDIQAAESALAPLGPKIDVLEKQTRALAGTLDKMLKEQIDKKLEDKATVKKIEDAIDAAVKEISAYGESIGKKRKAQLSAKDTIKSAMTKAKNDPWTFVAWAKNIYETYNDANDLADITKDLASTAKGLKVVLTKAIEMLS